MASDGIGLIITFLFGLGIALVVFLVLRAVMLWYWKIDVIVDRLENLNSNSNILVNERIKQYRIDFYIALSLKDNKQAYVSLMNIIMDELLRNDIKGEARKKRYDELKEKYTATIDKLGYPFPEYELLF